MRLTLATLVLLGGCNPLCPPLSAPEAPAPAVVASKDAPLPLTVSIKDLMGGAIAFSAHVVEQVEETDAPLTTSDWNMARSVSSDLIATATLLTTPSTNAMDNLRRQDGQWRSLAKALHDAGGDVAAATRKQDRAGLKSAVSAMRAACQSCHTRYGAHGQ